MLRMDMEAAEIPDLVETRAGVAVVDFHSFRDLQVTNAMTEIPSGFIGNADHTFHLIGRKTFFGLNHHVLRIKTSPRIRDDANSCES